MAALSRVLRAWTHKKGKLYIWLTTLLCSRALDTPTPQGLAESLPCPSWSAEQQLVTCCAALGLALHQALCRWRTLLMASRLLLTSCELLSPSLVEGGSGELLHNKRSQVSSL